MVVAQLQAVSLIKIGFLDHNLRTRDQSVLAVRYDLLPRRQTRANQGLSAARLRHRHVGLTGGSV